MSSIAITRQWNGTPETIAASAGRCFHLLLESPRWLYLATLAVMLFRPPGLEFYHLDRIALLLLVFVVILGGLVRRQSFRLADAITWPMLALMALSAWGVASQPYQSELWSSFATRWLVPFAFYHLVQLTVFNDGEEFEIFSLVVLAYLSAIAIFFLLGMQSLIFPKFILDENLGIHAERARGPFLQAVANGVTLNLLGLLALNAFRRGRLRGGMAMALLGALPIAILATKTRAVWLSFALSILIVPFTCQSRRLRNACLTIAGVSTLAVFLAMNFSASRVDLSERLGDESPVTFRASLYRAGWEMFLEKPLLGWNASEIQPELSRRISDFQSEDFVFHNSYLDVAVAHGSLGLLLYLSMFAALFRLGRPTPIEGETFLDSGFRKIWPLMVGVYALNACFVLMQYQFINAVLFSLAGMLAAQNRSALREAQ
ncbi:MAG TPA: O-antigen ligase family protein [Terriglobales bacterium]|jgi:O-antigen ligase|nr:O-antigen ligase family protein [Terriglobales bacterium]